MTITVIAILTFLLVTFVGAGMWVAYSKDDSDENVKKIVNKVASILFWGTMLLLIAVTKIYT